MGYSILFLSAISQSGSQEVRGLNVKMKERIAVWLSADGHTKQDLASMLGVSPRTLRNRMTDTYEWTWNEVKLLAKVLDCSTEDLI